jgi:hypothetical protein
MGILHKQKNITKKIESSFLLQILTCIILSSIIIGVFLLFNKVIDVKNYRKYSLEEDIKLMTCVENIFIENKFLSIEGYGFQLEQDSENSAISIILRNLKKNDEIWMKVEAVSRPDVQDYFDSEYNYEDSGFIATTKQNNLDMDEGYEIIIDLNTINDNGKTHRTTVSTNQYLYEGKLISYNPYEFVQPDMNIQSETLQKIFNEGTLYFYREEYGLYIYEYQDKLYWIATENLQFDKEGQTLIAYQLFTSQVSKLPEDRISYGFDNQSFNLEDYEFIDEITVPYRIAVRDIPTDYAITYIKTGVYNRISKRWFWDDSFQLGLKNLE